MNFGHQAEGKKGNNGEMGDKEIGDRKMGRR
jgi:hypothetical protein